MEQGMQLRARKGTFRAVALRDGEALSRDGEPFYAFHEIPSGDGALFEVLFADGMWMLATPADLDFEPDPRERQRHVVP